MTKKIVNKLFKDNKLIYFGIVYITFIITLLISILFIRNIPVKEKIVYVPVYINMEEETKTCLSNTPIIKEELIIYDNSNLKKCSSLTEEDLNIILKDTNLEEQSSFILEMESKYNINGVFLTALILNNSSYGTSERCILYNNYTNLAVYDDYSQGMIFESPEECIEFTANLLCSEYLNEDGNYFNGYSLNDISKNFCNSEIWINNINEISIDILNTLNK